MVSFCEGKTRTEYGGLGAARAGTEKNGALELRSGLQPWNDPGSKATKHSECFLLYDFFSGF